ncbi:single-stranded DNA-binding protein [Actinoplanes aureus]|uniref:Single-stranded DNA-binding protein n=1 Tax=Actinoplanes aureus TaxID=2792083 RepID=A0A931CES2_9ACTN|nr:hypothetical protein [Actinoplanes aureus]MBG0568794.1 hypothetical protein [Actinoplanes aureus]
MQLNITVEGTLTRSAVTGETRDGREFVQFQIVHRPGSYRDNTGREVTGKPMYFDILCWGDLAGRARDLTRGTTIVAEISRLIPFEDDGELGIKAFARNLSISMRYAEAHAGPQVRQRRGDLVTTPHGETITAQAYPDVVGDRELVHNR